jgi:hypothetical protein
VSLLKSLVALTLILSWILCGAHSAFACEYDRCPDTGLDDGAVEVGDAYSGDAVADLVGGKAQEAAAYAWRIVRLCVLAEERDGFCSPSDIRPCPQEPGKVIEFMVVMRRAVVQPDGTAVVPVPDGAQPGDLLGEWEEVRRGCIDITSLNPPPSPAEVFSYFERLPLPLLTAQHQPPGNGLSGLPVIFYTDDPTTETFTVDIRGFEVVINAEATTYTWTTGDRSEPTITTDHPGAAYPDQTITHAYASGTYTTSLTVTWGATFTVDGSAPADVPGTTTTTGPPETFQVLQARPVLVNPN